MQLSICKVQIIQTSPSWDASLFSGCLHVHGRCGTADAVQLMRYSRCGTANAVQPMRYSRCGTLIYEKKWIVEATCQLKGMLSLLVCLLLRGCPLTPSGLMDIPEDVEPRQVGKASARSEIALKFELEPDV